MSPYQIALQVIEDLIQACTCGNIPSEEAEKFLAEARKRLGPAS